MLTVFFIILQITDQIFLSWWWIVLFLILDSAYLNGNRGLHEKINDLENRILEIEGKEFYNKDEENEDYE